MSAESDLSPADYRALGEFRYQLRRFLHFSEQAVRSAGLEPQQHQLLLAIKGLPLEKPPSIGELAERLQLQHHSTVELIDRMVERKLILRQRDSGDQRRVLIILTPTGEDVLRKLSLLHRMELRTLGPTLVLALHQLIGNPDDEVEKHGPEENRG